MENHKNSSKPPIVSVCIAVFNGGHSLERALKSIIHQTDIDIEILIADGKSTDNSIDIIREYSKYISWHQSKKDNGVYDAWNEIIKHAKGEWICFLGADDYFSQDDVLSRYIKIAKEAPPGCRLIYSKVKYFDEDQSFQFEQGMPWCDSKVNLRHKMMIPHVGMLQHRSIFDEGFRFDSRYKISGDFDLVRREGLLNGAFFWNEYTVNAQTGGLSTNPKNEFKHILEEGSILWSQSRRIYGSWLISLVKISLRSLIYKAFGMRGLNKYEKLKNRIKGKSTASIN